MSNQTLENRARANERGFSSFSFSPYVDRKKRERGEEGQKSICYVAKKGRGKEGGELDVWYGIRQ